MLAVCTITVKKKKILQISMFICLLRFDRKVSAFFSKHFITTCKSTSLSIECFRCYSRFGTPRSKSASGYGPLFADLNSPLPKLPFKHRLNHIW